MTRTGCLVAFGTSLFLWLVLIKLAMRLAP